jgi:hypothetical protein
MYSSWPSNTKCRVCFPLFICTIRS